MGEFRGQVDFAEEALGADRLGDIRTKHFQRNVTVVAGVIRQVDRGHSTTAQLALERIAVAQRAFELLS